jgi:hypothetical protein
MLLPPNFIFSQSSLQDFVDCRRRFYLRYLLKLRWPAVQSEPVLEVEKLTQNGISFHRHVHQRLLGMPDEKLLPLEQQAPMSEWWQNFSQYGQILPGVLDQHAFRYPERSLYGSVNGYRLVAKYDLIVLLSDGTTIIYDWKTSKYKPKRKWLLSRIQTVLYPYLMVSSGQKLFPSGPIPAESIRLTYWYPAFPSQPEQFEYNQPNYHRDGKQISGLIRLIDRLAQSDDENNFPLTDNINRCNFCVYRSLCNRGTVAGKLDDNLELESVNEELFSLDFDQITEVAFE